MKVHFIAVGGSAMHNLAIALAKNGYEVSGSDDVIFEPSRSRLAKYGILPEKEGWDTAHIHPDLDAVILGMHARQDNPELLKAQELGLKIYSYPEYIYEQSKDKLRVVIGGSHGKTTITSMILHVLNHCKKDFDYLVGAQLEGFDTMVRLSRAPLIVIEGDEYLSSPIDRRPKFHLYKANLAVISGIAWDHINVFPTFDNYKEQFAAFIRTIVPGGALIYNAEDPVLEEVAGATPHDVERIPYTALPSEIENGLTYLHYGGKRVALQVFGQHNLSNLAAAYQVCRKLGVADAAFFDAVQSFRGAAKRLELLDANEDTAVFKDFAHSPSKLKATIDAVKDQFKDRELVAVIELHTFSSLNKDFLNEYSGCMDKADTAVVFIDKHTFEQKRMEPYDAGFVKKAFSNNNLFFFENVKEMELYLRAINYKRKILLLMSSGNFGGMDLPGLAAFAAKKISTI